jgi:DNA-binding NarL/FixJ family response regulator
MSTPVAAVILVVEDHQLTLQMVAALLSRAFPEYIVQGAETANAALASFHALKPRVVVMDIGLPDGNGIELTRTMTLPGSQTDVVIYSAEDCAVFREEAQRAGAGSFVSKRNPGDLVANVAAILRHPSSRTLHNGSENA